MFMTEICRGGLIIRLGHFISASLIFDFLRHMTRAFIVQMTFYLSGLYFSSYCCKFEVKRLDFVHSFNKRKQIFCLNLLRNVYISSKASHLIS